MEAFEHLKKQCKKAEEVTQLQEETLYGIEPKPLPYLLCQMNLLLHGVEYPQIDPVNAAFTVTFIRFLPRDHRSSDMFIGTGLGLAIAERTFHARCNPEFESQCKRHQWRWRPMKMEVQ